VDEDERDGEKAEGGHTSREEEREEMLTEEQTGEEEQNKLREKQEERGERQEKQYAGQEREEPEGQVAAEEKKEEKPKREQLAGEDKSREEEGKTEKGSSKAEHAAKKDQGENNRFLEKGLIYFFYRPKVGVEEVHDLEHVRSCRPFAIYSFNSVVMDMLGSTRFKGCILSLYRRKQLRWRIWSIASIV